MSDDFHGYMCPNCVTPWKCNGPHIAEERSMSAFTDWAYANAIIAKGPDGKYIPSNCAFAAKSAWSAALEAAAKVCADHAVGIGGNDWDLACLTNAAAIRALKDD